MAKKRKTKIGSGATKNTVASHIDITSILENAQLVALRLRHGQCTLIATPESPPELQQTIAVQAEYDQGKARTATVQATFTLRDEKHLHIEAAFELLYEIGGQEKIALEQMRAFGQIVGVNNAWPYWREFVQSTTTRMGLPPLTMPLMRLGAIKPKSQPGTQKKKSPGGGRATTKKKQK
ncbi:MAG: protein-export chaperone SecB [Pirellulales bacterium]|nr:protein-export chaperone SecB [Pirellulales bacterium]